MENVTSSFLESQSNEELSRIGETCLVILVQREVPDAELNDLGNLLELEECLTALVQSFARGVVRALKRNRPKVNP